MNEDEIEVYRAPRPVWPIVTVALVAVGVLFFVLVRCGTAPAVAAGEVVTTVPVKPAAGPSVVRLPYAPRLPVGYSPPPTGIPPMRSAIEAGVRSVKASYRKGE